MASFHIISVFLLGIVFVSYGHNLYAIFEQVKCLYADFMKKIFCYCMLTYFYKNFMLFLSIRFTFFQNDPFSEKKDT